VEMNKAHSPTYPTLQLFSPHRIASHIYTIGLVPFRLG
jgi:hypothetical protein